MPIPSTDLVSNFLELDLNCSLKSAIDQAGDEDEIYLVITLGGGRFVAVLLKDVKEELDRLPRRQDRTRMLNAALGDLLASLAIEGIDQAITDGWQGELARRRSPTGCLVVTSAGKISGLLAPKQKDAVVYRSAFQPKGVLSMDATGGEAQVEAPAVPQASKKINVQLVDPDYKPLRPEEKPLQVGSIYTLIINMSDIAQSASIIAEAFLQYQWKDVENEITLTVRLQSDDFKILTLDPQKMTVPRQGDSTKVRFDLQAQKEGPGVVNILFFKEELFVQLLTLKFTVVDGSMFSSTSVGREIQAAFTAAARPLTITILESVGAYQVIMMTGATAATGSLPITHDALAVKLEGVRKVLRDEIVYMLDAPSRRYIFQDGVKIPDAARDAALKRMADVGYSLYRDIFYSADADVQANLLGDRLREMARGAKTLHIQVFSQHFLLPWGLLYLAGEDEYNLNEIHPEWFLGLSHIVEHIPLQQKLLVTDSAIDSREGLTVSINVNPEIDAQMKAPLVGKQIDYWKHIEGLGKVKLVQRTTASDLLNALRSTQSTPDQIIYFYCHAATQDLQKGGPDASLLVLGSQEKVTLKDLKQQAPSSKVLPGEPLVFINACESAELSPLVYDGFVPYFLAKGARGVIGTECETPAIFAVEWARQFFDRFLKGDPLGQIVLDLRKEFFSQENNPLGLLYALFVDGDTRVEPGFNVGG